MKKIVTKVYEYAELSDKAKETARDWLREWYPDHGWWENVYDDADTVGLKISGFDTGRGNSIDIEYLSDCTADDTAMSILDNHGEACDTYKEAHHYLYEIKETWDEEKEEDWEYDERAEEWSKDFLQTIGKEYLSALRKELEYLESDESLAEMIEGNEYTFTEDGKRFG